jgi:hypothetical protein
MIDFIVWFVAPFTCVGVVYTSYKNHYRLSTLFSLGMIAWLTCMLVIDIRLGNAGAAIFWVILIVGYLQWAVRNILDYLEDKQATEKKRET